MGRVGLLAQHIHDSTNLHIYGPRSFFFGRLPLFLHKVYDDIVKLLSNPQDLS